MVITLAVFLGICMLLFDYHFTFIVYPAVTVLIFDAYLIIDIARLSNGKVYHLDYDEFIVGSAILYIDFIVILFQIVANIGKSIIQKKKKTEI